MAQLDVQYYFVRSPTGYLSLGRLNATPKLYTLGGARAVARRRSRPRSRYEWNPATGRNIAVPLPPEIWEVVPVALVIGTPVSL